jgi:methionine sulfoxide reductase heme-binding subunit
MSRRLKAGAFVLALAPFLWLLFRALTGRLTVNPVEDIQLTTGDWALRFLLITLAITPLRRLTGWNAVIQIRRQMGLFAFFYATLHFLAYLVFDQVFDFGHMLVDVAKRPFITFGFLAFVSLVPLAITSTKGWIRRLGRRWQVLHRLIYVAAILASIHFIWKVKVAIGQPVYCAVILALLLAFRVVWRLRPPAGARRQTAGVSAS